MTVHHPDDLIRLFNDCFIKSHHTILAYGGDEPLYIPANETQTYHTIFFAHGFFNSALHECAHWFLAGEKRRQLIDYGYWYIPDGRNVEEQALFQQVEVKPQALEWVLSQAAGSRFHCSIDNLKGLSSPYEKFQSDVEKQMLDYQKKGLPPRARLFQQALLSYYQQKRR
ncbi:MAG: elongation factor P hydroxylase [Gammaproteobacteria bacterium]|nr:elongation factor P hydroxylase [Gammaproteobacteria bacterium]